MKQLLLIGTCVLSLFSLSQTDVIAARSHSSEVSQSPETDNYGLPSRTVDSIIYIGNGCIVEDAFWYGRDTFCDHPLFVENNFDLKKLKKLYPSYVIFKGFSTSEKRKLDKENSMFWFAALLGVSYLFYLFFPKLFVKKDC